MKKSRLIDALFTSFCLMSICMSQAHAAAVSGQGTWETTLEARDLDGNLATIEAWYDTVLEVTWLDETNTLGSWAVADTWAAGLDFGGIDNWRLPLVLDTGASGCPDANPFNGGDCGYNVDTGSAATTVYSELASIFYDTLGNLAFFDTAGGIQAGSGLTNTGPFANLVAGVNWGGQADTLTTAWSFNLATGFQGILNTPGTNTAYALAVHAGDVGTAVIPVPATVWLFGSGLLGLIGVARKRRG
jgi:hypothetical protein